MQDAALFKELIEQTAEATARRVTQEMRVDISRAYERIGIIENVVGIGPGNGNGIKKELEVMHRNCEERKHNCESNMSAIRSIAQQGNRKVTKWHWLAVGAAAGVVACAAFVEFVLRIKI